MDKATYSEGEVYTAMCLWEAILDRLNEGTAPWQYYREREGMATLRDTVLGLAKECEAAWNALTEDQQDAQAPFDWEFCPRWLENEVDWSWGTGPFVRPREGGQSDGQ